MNLSNRNMMYKEKINTLETKLVNRNIASQLIIAKCNEMYSEGRYVSLTGYINGCIERFKLDKEVKLNKRDKKRSNLKRRKYDK